MKQWKLYLGELFLKKFSDLCTDSMSKNTLLLWIAFIESYAKDNKLNVKDKRS